MKQSTTLIILAFFVIFAGWAGAQDAPEAEPQALLDGAVDALQSARSFRLAIEQTGAPYQLALSFDGVNMLPATLSSAEAQIISPDELYISAHIHLILPLSLDIYSRDARQWLSFPSGAPWLQLPAFEGFDISRLLAPGDGIEKVMTNLNDAQINADRALVDERPVWHIQATAAGDAVEGLLFGFIDPQGDVTVDAYIDTENGRLLLIEILMLETIGDSETDPSVWRVEFYDYDAPRDFEPPAG
ncbi:MAG: LppX_LprAFG lipoprotein [Chloroflexota bacterium]|nr:LppX_LprAFG lipoprotein [Chloroflexota bacterium]MDE2946778.1 LppX_LprAFG lipoprotein [Chloroflexota bacterium]